MPKVIEKLKEQLLSEAKRQVFELGYSQMTMRSIANACAVTDEAKKKELSSRYVKGLLSQGGPSTDVFKKQLGEEKTKTLFENVLFGTGL